MNIPNGCSPKAFPNGHYIEIYLLILYIIELYLYFNSSLNKKFNSNSMNMHKFWILKYQSLIWKSQLLLTQFSFDPNKIMWKFLLLVKYQISL